jgi:C4-dicarboxylate transporter DctQ subunit
VSRTSALRSIDRGLLRIETMILGAGILGIAGISIVNVLARNLLGGSLPFAEELNQALAVWITFAGVGLGARRARHIRMAAFYDQLRGRSRKLAWMVTTASTSALLFVLAWLAVRYVATLYSIGGVTPALRVPLWAAYSVAPAGLALGALEYALTFARNLGTDRILASVDLEEGHEEPEGAA